MAVSVRIVDNHSLCFAARSIGTSFELCRVGSGRFSENLRRGPMNPVGEIDFLLGGEVSGRGKSFRKPELVPHKVRTLPKVSGWCA